MKKVATVISVFVLLLSGLASSHVTSEELERAPDVELPEIYTDKTIGLKDYRGTVVLLDFWASWCGPCRASFPEYSHLRNRLQSELGTESFEVLAINVDITTEEAKAFLSENSVDFPILRETTGKSQRAYNLVGLPTSFLIDQAGNIHVAHQGFSKGYITLLESKIRTLLENHEGEAH